MPTTFNDLAFSPSVGEILSMQAGRNVTVFTGKNNSGKSAYLKKMSTDRTKMYIGVNRFYSFHHLPLFNKNDSELDMQFQNLTNQSFQPYHNFEGSFFNCNTAITRLNDERRGVLFDTFYSLFGERATVQAEVPDNVFSNRYVSIGGESLSVTSSGTRLFLGILAALMDERFSVVALDEPELGLSPSLQAKLASVIINRENAEKLLPHNPHIFISTHAHTMLDKVDPTNNFIVERNGNLITAHRCQGISGLNDIQFRMLGNQLGSLFLPDAIMLVEGETDKIFLSAAIALFLPKLKIVIESCGGDIAARLHYWSSLIGDLQTSPYKHRTFVIYDSVKQAGLEKICDKVGIPNQNRIEWSGNGIEYIYPASALSSIFRSSIATVSNLEISGDRVSLGEMTYTKMQLVNMVVGQLNEGNLAGGEFEQKLLNPLREVLV